MKLVWFVALVNCTKTKFGKVEIEDVPHDAEDMIGDLAYPADVLKRMQRGGTNITGIPVAKEFQVRQKSTLLRSFSYLRLFLYFDRSTLATLLRPLNFDLFLQIWTFVLFKKYRSKFRSKYRKYRRSENGRYRKGRTNAYPKI